MASKMTVLFCDGRMSASLPVNEMKESSQSAGKDYSVEAHDVASEASYVPDADCVLPGPQIRYVLNNLKKKYTDKLISSIDMRTYGAMDGKGAVEQARKLIND